MPGFDPGAEGATAPETLRQKDRAGLDTLESNGPVRPFAEGARTPLGFGISQAQGQRGRIFRAAGPVRQVPGALWLKT